MKRPENFFFFLVVSVLPSVPNPIHKLLMLSVNSAKQSVEDLLGLVKFVSNINALGQV